MQNKPANRLICGLLFLILQPQHSEYYRIISQKQNKRNFYAYFDTSLGVSSWLLLFLYKKSDTQ